MSTSNANSVPTLQVVQGWDRADVVNFLKTRQNELELEYGETERFNTRGMNGLAFLELNVKTLTRKRGAFEIPYGVAQKIIRLIKRSKDKGNFCYNYNICLQTPHPHC